MGLIKKTKDAWKNATTEKTNFGKTEPQESLSSPISNWLENSASETTKLVLMICAVVLIIAVIVWGIYQVYFVPESDDENVSTVQTSQTNSSARYEIYFENLSDWVFLTANEQTKTANDIYEQLINLGIEKGTIVYCLSDYTESGNNYLAYIRESTNSTYYQVSFDVDKNVTLKAISKEDLPDQEEQKAIEAQTKAEEAERQKLESAYKKDDNTVSKEVDISNGLRNVSLTDTSTLSNFLPLNCAQLIASSLVTGMRESYGFEAIADYSAVRPETLEVNGNEYSFVAQMIDSKQNVLLVWVTWDESSQTFSGQRIEN